MSSDLFTKAPLTTGVFCSVDKSVTDEGVWKNS
jgi:hypothetical protein